jgi:hypothetical protein
VFFVLVQCAGDVSMCGSEIFMGLSMGMGKISACIASVPLSISSDQ